MRIKTDENKVWGRGENKDGTRMEAEEIKPGDGMRINGGDKIGN